MGAIEPAVGRRLVSGWRVNGRSQAWRGGLTSLSVGTDGVERR